MPKPTFFNLPELKRNRIIEAAIIEFSNNSYDLASINRVVEQSEISKGSFYQYFEDKEDLYVYLLESSIEAKLAYLEPVICNLEGVLFLEQVKRLFEAGIAFAKQHPEWVAIGTQFAHEQPNKIHAHVFEKYGHLSQNVFEKLIQQAIQNGEISNAVDPLVVGLLISETGSTISKLAENDWDRMSALLDSLLFVLENGIKP